MTESQLPFDPPLPSSAQTELARLYHEYRKADLESSPKSAEVCTFVRDNKLTRSQLLVILEDNVKMKPESAKVEATHILNLIKDSNAEILQALIDGKMTVSDARKNSTIKAIKEWEDNVKMKPESANVPTEVSAKPTPACQPDSAPPAAPKEKQAGARAQIPLINNRPLSPEEHAARAAATGARFAEMTPEEREGARAAALKGAGILTPEELKERRAAIQAQQQARIEKLPPEQQASLAADKARAKRMMAEARARTRQIRRSADQRVKPMIPTIKGPQLE